MQSTTSIFILGLVSLAAAHMQLVYPPPLGAENNPHRTDPPSPYMQYPYGCCGQTDMSPCHGMLKVLGTPQGAPVASWAAGSTQNWNVSGKGNHYGGSCQIGFSVDKGKTFKVTTSYEGNCPHRTGGATAAGQNFPFTVPKDVPTGDQIFAWTWNNREGEFNMNCAVVTITGGSGGNSAPAPAVSSSTPSDPKKSPSATAKGDAPPPQTTDDSKYEYDDDEYHCVCLRKSQKLRRSIPKVRSARFRKARDTTMAFKDRPAMLFADTNTGCKSPKTNAELKYPNPGPDVVKGDGEYKLDLPTGTC